MPNSPNSPNCFSIDRSSRPFPDVLGSCAERIKRLATTCSAPRRTRRSKFATFWWPRPCTCAGPPTIEAWPASVLAHQNRSVRMVQGNDRFGPIPKIALPARHRRTAWADLCGGRIALHLGSRLPKNATDCAARPALVARQAVQSDARIQNALVRNATHDLPLVPVSPADGPTPDEQPVRISTPLQDIRVQPDSADVAAAFAGMDDGFAPCGPFFVTRSNQLSGSPAFALDQHQMWRMRQD
jgi:hypothetical protein